MLQSQGNDVFATLNKTIDAIKDYKVARLQNDMFRRGSTEAMAAPSGAPGYTVFNPLPFAWGNVTNPQAAGAPAPGGTSMLSGGGAMWLILGAVLLVVALFAKR